LQSRFWLPSLRRARWQPGLDFARKELARERMLLLTEGHCLRDQAFDLRGRADLVAERDDVDFRATSLETIYEMVACGMGCTLLPSMASKHLKAGESRTVLIPLEVGVSRRIGLVYRSTYPMQEDLACLARIIGEHATNDVERLFERDARGAAAAMGGQRWRAEKAARLKAENE